VQYFDRVTGKEEQVHAKVVVMGASAVDTTRILLNSKSGRHPNGLGNGSDVIGRYLCEQLRVHVAGFLPQLYGNGVQNDLGIGGEHIYMPRFNHRLKNLNYLRGYQMQFWNTGCQPYNLPRVANLSEGFGASMKADIKRKYPAWVELHPFGETLPYRHNRITVDESQPDRYGVPKLKIDYQIGENEKKMADHIYDVLEEVGKAGGIEWVHFKRGELDSNGSAIHEHGCCRMGADPKASALNKWNQMHEVKNVFVVDGSAFTSASEKNPTLTILALSWRATDYLAEEIRKGNL
jgi:choline dehydrogenase-like flavoprotein